MKKIISMLLAALIFISCCGFTYDKSNYMEEMEKCAVIGTLDMMRRGSVYEFTRNLKIEESHLLYRKTHFFSMYLGRGDLIAHLNFYQSVPAYTEEEFELIAKIIHAEAGSYWLSDEWKLCVGEVVLNRVASPEFPNTIREVLEQPGQYYGVNNPYFESIQPSEKSYEMAWRLLNGERYLNDLAVVFQSNYILGSGIAVQFNDSKLGSTYFCYSSYMYLYEE